MNNYLENIEDKESFIQGIKDALDSSAFEKLEDMKKEMANDFLTGEEE